MTPDQIAQLEALVRKTEVLKHEHGRFTSKNRPGTPFDDGVRAAQSDVIQAAGVAAPAIAQLLAAYKEQAVRITELERKEEA